MSPMEKGIKPENYNLQDESINVKTFITWDFKLNLEISNSSTLASSF